MTKGFNNNDSVKAPVGPAALIGAVVLLVLLVGGLAYYFLMPHGESVAPRPLTQSEIYVQKMAKQAQGDFSKLSPAEQQEMIQKLGPSAPVTLRMSYVAQQKH